MTNSPEDISSEQAQVSAAYSKATGNISPGSHLDATILELAKTQLEQSSKPGKVRPRLFGIPVRALMASAALALIATAGVTLLMQGSPSWQPTPGTDSSKRPATLPPVPAIEAPLLVPPSEQDKTPQASGCEPEAAPPCPSIEPPEAASAP